METKLCKDCKHVKLPLHPMANSIYRHVVAFPMCAHPTAMVDPVYGHTVETCEMARMGTNCGRNARLFEPHPPRKPPDAALDYHSKPAEFNDPPQHFTLAERFARWIWGAKD